MKDRLIAYQSFAEVAASGSFSTAAERLRLSKSQVSRLVSALEQRLGAALLRRTTRTVSLTDAGRVFLTQVTSALDQLAEAETFVRAAPSELKGRLRVSAPTVIGAGLVASTSVAFMAQHPALSVILTLADRPVDPTVEGYDVAIRVGEISGSDGSAVLGQMALGLYASPSYLARHGRPRAPDDLSAHRLLHFDAGGRIDRPWRLRDGYGERVFSFDPILFTNSAEAAKLASLSGLGISQLPVFFAAEDIASGRLVSLLDGFEPKPLLIEAVLPRLQGRPHGTAHYLSALAAAFRRLPT